MDSQPRMNPPSKRVFVAGGTGFLGYAAIQEFVRLDYEVVTIALPNEIDTKHLFDKQVVVFYDNLFAMDEAQLISLFKNSQCERFVYALGPDDRVTVHGDAWTYFHHFLVEKSEQIIVASKKAGFKHVVVLSSYFAYFDRQFSGELSKRHPYIRARVRQQAVLEALNHTDQFSVCFLELPYIFGVMKGRKPIWRDALLDRIDIYPWIFFPRGGGTAMIDVEDVSRAIVAATMYGRASGKYFIGETNMRFYDFLNLIQTVKKQPKKIILLPTWIVAIGARSLQKKHQRAGKQSGLDYYWLMKQILSRPFYYPNQDYKTELNFQALHYVEVNDVRQSILKTMTACYDEK